MYWQEKDEHYRVSDEIIEIIFKVGGKTLCRQYEELLAEALFQLSPWLAQDERIAIFLNHAIEEGNGWYADDNPDNPLYLSRRTKLFLRIPSEKEDALLEELNNAALDVGGHALELKHSQSRLLNPTETLYSRFLLSDEDEEAFLENMAKELVALGIRPMRLLCGKQRELTIGGKTQMSRSLMVNDLEKQEAVILQQSGIGPYRQYGCGVFVPYKSIS